MPIPFYGIGLAIQILVARSKSITFVEMQSLLCFLMDLEFHYTEEVVSLKDTFILNEFVQMG